MSKTFDHKYEQYFNDVCVHRLSSEYNRIKELVHNRLHQYLKDPMFAIDWNMGKKWGEWNPETRTIRLNVSLFRDFEWAAVVRVLKHEVAHQIVSEIFNFNSFGCTHGEHWKIACEAVNLDTPTRCDSANFLDGLKGGQESLMVTKVRMLMAKGSDNAVTKEESQLFLNKAQELMMKHQITSLDVTGTDKVHVKRPVGKHYKRFPHWLWDIGNLLSEFYSVRCIRTYAYVPNKGFRYYLELFGEPQNLDVAEYMFYGIINNGKILFNRALEEHRNKWKTDQHYKAQVTRYSYDTGKERCSKFTEATFMRALVSAFKMQLYNQRTEVKRGMDAKTVSDYMLVSGKNEALLEEMYGKAYGKVTHTSLSGYSGASRSAGTQAGANLRLRQGVTSSGNSGRYLGA